MLYLRLRSGTLKRWCSGDAGDLESPNFHPKSQITLCRVAVLKFYIMMLIFSTIVHLLFVKFFINTLWTSLYQDRTTSERNFLIYFYVTYLISSRKKRRKTQNVKHKTDEESE